MPSPTPGKPRSTFRNLISRFNDHERNKAWSRDDPMHVYSVPEDERVAVPSIWVVELFPPSRFDSLHRPTRGGLAHENAVGVLLVAKTFSLAVVVQRQTGEKGECRIV
jgi:hypothetical protein